VSHFPYVFEVIFSPSSYLSKAEHLILGIMGIVSLLVALSRIATSTIAYGVLLVVRGTKL
jgi:hypothetical protein